MSRRKGIAAAVTVLALAVAAAAVAGNSTGFTDGKGDAGAGPDVSQVTVSSDDAGLITVRVETDTPAIVLEQGIWLVLDVDQNPDTGTVVDGAEWAFQLKWAHGIEAYRASGDFFEETAPPPSLTAGFANPATTFTFKAADVGITSGFNLAVVSANLFGNLPIRLLTTGPSTTSSSPARSRPR